MDNYFGLGFVLNVEDNASSAFGNASTAMQSLMGTAQETFTSMNVAGMAMSQLGNSAMSAGQQVLSGFMNVGKTVVSTGDDFEKTMITLSALYGTAEEAKKKMDWAMDFSARSPFEITDIKSALVGFKSAGVDATQTITAVGGSTKEFMSYVGDLAALRPDKSISDIVAGVRNALGGDGGKSLRARLDMNPTQILGRSLGNTSKQIMQDIADMAQKTAPDLMTKLNGTFSQMVSNLNDQKTRLFKGIADGGAFAMVKGSLQKIYDAVGSISQERLEGIGKSLADCFAMVFKPLDLIVEGLIKVFNWMVWLEETYPALGKFVVGFLAISGVLLVATGLFFKFAGGILMALGGLGMLITTIISFGGVSNIISVIASSLGGLVASVLPAIAMVGLLFLAWKNNFMGIRDMTITFVNNTKLAFSESNRIANASFEDFSKGITVLKDLVNEGDFFAGLTLGLVKLQVIWKAVVESWNGESLTDETFKKVQALGLLPLISFIQDLHRNFTIMWQGFKVGFESILSTILFVGGVIGKAIQTIAETLKPVINRVAEFINITNKVSGDKFEFIGEVIGKLAGLFIASKIVGLFGTLAKSVVSTALSFGRLAIALLANPFTWVVLAIVAVVAAFTYFYKTSDTFRSKINGMMQSATPFITAMKAKLVPVIKSIVSTVEKYLPVAQAVFSSVWSLICEIVGNAINFIIDNLPQIQAVFSSVWDYVCAVVELAMHVIQGLIIPVVVGIYNIIQQNMPFISSIVGSGLKIIMSVIQIVYDFLTTYVIPGIQALVDIISIFIPPLVTIITDFCTDVMRGLDVIISGFSTLVGWVKDAVSWLKSWNDTDMDSKSATITTTGETAGSSATSDYTNGSSAIATEAGNMIKPALSTGAEIYGTGEAILHPNEVVVNGELTKKLRTFLNSNVSGTSTPALATLGTQSQSTNSQNASGKLQQDNSVTFQNGAIQITMNNGNEADVNNLVKIISDKLQKQMQLNSMRNYKSI